MLGDAKLCGWGLGVDFTNIFTHSFYAVAPKSIRIQSNCQYLFMLLGSTRTKAACKMMMKLTLGVVKVAQDTLLAVSNFRTDSFVKSNKV